MSQRVSGRPGAVEEIEAKDGRSEHGDEAASRTDPEPCRQTGAEKTDGLDRDQRDALEVAVRVAERTVEAVALKEGESDDCEEREQQGPPRRAPQLPGA